MSEYPEFHLRKWDGFWIASYDPLRLFDIDPIKEMAIEKLKKLYDQSPKEDAYEWSETPPKWTGVWEYQSKRMKSSRMAIISTQYYYGEGPILSARLLREKVDIPLYELHNDYKSYANPLLWRRWQRPDNKIGL